MVKHRQPLIAERFILVIATIGAPFVSASGPMAVNRNNAASRRVVDRA